MNYMTIDPYWASQMQAYISLYKAFHKELRQDLSPEDRRQLNEKITHL